MMFYEFKPPLYTYSKWILSNNWWASKEWIFSVSSFFMAMSRGHSLINPLYRIWKLKIPPRVIVFSWLALWGGVLTMDNLSWHRKIIVNACPVCLVNEESVDHLLLNCKVAQGLWSEVLNWFHCSWAHPRSIGGLVEAWLLEVGSIKRKLMCKTAFPALLWIIWNERNSQCFEDSSTSVENLMLRTSSNSPSLYGCPTFLNFMGFLLISFWGIWGRWSSVNISDC